MSDTSVRKKKKILGRTHTPAVVQGGGGGRGQMEPLPGVFYMFLILPLVQSQFSSS